MMKNIIIVIFLAFHIALLSAEESNNIKKIEKIFGKSTVSVKKIIKIKNKKEYFYYKIVKSDKSENYVLFSENIYTGKEGMNGKVPLIIVADIKFKILDIIMDENNETEVQIERIKKIKYLSKVRKYLNGESEKIDTVSGATYTSRAIVEGSRESIKRLNDLEK
jgi:Na+-translocating ferredoxin:NAD+ oxidoreductase RnfG subunit